MIPFFRKIRKKLADNNQFLKYSRYAIGEIVLVVIGILIALQVNNWNIYKNQQNKIKDYAKLYVQDLEADIAMIDINYRMISGVSAKIDSLANHVKNKKLNEISNIDFLCLTWNLLYRPYRWNRSTIDQMKNSGSLQNIEDGLIAKKIGEYEAFTYHMDEDYLNDKFKSENCLNLISQVVNSNYTNIKELRKNVLMKINNPELNDFHFNNEQEYIKSKSYNLNLIADDLKDIDLIINNLVRLQSYYDIRSDIELIQLTSAAEELIVLLNETYLEK